MTVSFHSGWQQIRTPKYNERVKSLLQMQEAFKTVIPETTEMTARLSNAQAEVSDIAGYQQFLLEFKAGHKL